ARQNFASLQRGYTASRQQGAGGAADAMPTLMRHEMPSRPRNQRAQVQGRQLEQQPRNQWDRAVASGTMNFEAVPFNTLGYLNAPFQDDAENGERKQVKPRAPFEWLAWNDRPFVSGNEVMLTPSSRPSQLLHEFSLNREGNPYSDEANQPEESPTFGHLMPFLFSGDATPDGEYPQGMYRILDYIHTPSLQVGAQRWLNPLAFNAVVRDAMDPRALRRPPFNTVCEFRDPGRVNVNTITSEIVWAGIEHNYDIGDGTRRRHLGPSFDGRGRPGTSIVASRRGYAGGNGLLTLNNEAPTFFANPFRAPDEGELTPLAELVRRGVECTLLRSDGLAPQQPGDEPLLFDTQGVNAGGQQFDAEDPDYPQNVNRHAAFYHAASTRLDNLLTTRSNVYAVWITIGFFEVEQAPPWLDDSGQPGEYQSGVSVAEVFGGDQWAYDQAYPDGYMLGREAGIDTGDNRRLRGFYVVDRTIPVGYQPGVDHHVEDAIRLQRRIE
ncbi:MAG: hypothetical protein AAF961_02795, partial [Planctomycetota bacterium]